MDDPQLMLMAPVNLKGSPVRETAAMASQTTSSFAQTYRILVSALMGAPVLIGLVLAFAGSTGDDDWLTGVPDVLFAGLLLVAGAVLLALLPVLGYRMEPLGKDTEPRDHRTAQTRFQSASILRFAFAELPVMLGIALAFIDGAFLLYLIGAVIGLGLMALHVLPTRQVIGKSAEVLEANGVESGLRAEFGFAQH